MLQNQGEKLRFYDIVYIRRCIYTQVKMLVISLRYTLSSEVTQPNDEYTGCTGSGWQASTSWELELAIHYTYKHS